MNRNRLYVFTDASVNKNLQKAVGGYLILDTLDVESITDDQFNYIVMDSSSSTIAEMTTILQVLSALYTSKYQITLYTDCLNFVNLVRKRKDKPKLSQHRNYHLYKQLIDLSSKIDIVWTKGHDNQNNKTQPHQTIFSLLDKAVRSYCRSL